MGAKASAAGRSFETALAVLLRMRLWFVEVLMGLRTGIGGFATSAGPHTSS